MAGACSSDPCGFKHHLSLKLYTSGSWCLNKSREPRYMAHIHSANSIRMYAIMQDGYHQSHVGLPACCLLCVASIPDTLC
jgi:hypothetical protein